MEVEDECLLSYAMKGRWGEAVEAYKRNPKALVARTTKSEETAIHIAIYVGQTEFVTSLLDKIEKDECIRILSMQSSKGNTPLHLAAELGNLKICSSIAGRDSDLISCRNVQGETPLFLAAHYGNKDAFLCLLGYLKNKGDYSLCRRTNGDTILHSAIYDLAYQIIHLYPELAGSINEEGVSPLHILAMKPNCFKSSTRMETFDNLIYHCLIVDELEEEIEGTKRADRKRIEFEYPENYRTCMDMLTTPKNLLKVLTTGSTGSGKSARDEENPSAGRDYLKKKAARKQERSHRFPLNCETAIRFLVLILKVFLIIFGVGASWVRKIQRRKEKHVWAKQVMVELVRHASFHRYENTGSTPKYHSKSAREAMESHLTDQKKGMIMETPILVAAKMGVTEIVEKILDTFPLAIHDVDAENKNVVLLAIENRQPHVFSLLRNMELVKESAFRQVDAQGNSALHLAASCKDHKPWRVPGAAMQMQWEYKWYKLVKESVPPNFFSRYNIHGETAKHVFLRTHGFLIKEGSKWLTKTAESCSVVAALVATVAFTTSTAIPGGSNQNTGVPLLEGRPLFNLFTVASLVALCSSAMSLVMFLSILTSRFQEKDFAEGLPKKLLVGMSSLFTSIAAVLISFCAGHFFIVQASLRVAVYPIYVATCLPVTFFALVQLPLYFDLVLAICRKVPQRSYKVFSHEIGSSKTSHKGKEREKLP
ncbi:uncharacterized protein LOC129308525 isoform X2 [Prosopis cineraria]|uniref:uncharacterized protein LOC129308525 isoform X2 n=1 Tax=Prosopis cineraria TaxID=364024 RepID=UPI00240F9D7E|nr:uncharacterized protein LOC129308525 isoform X2 [Prosopis cineraria]